MSKNKLTKKDNHGLTKEEVEYCLKRMQNKKYYLRTEIPLNSMVVSSLENKINSGLRRYYNKCDKFFNGSGKIGDSRHQVLIAECANNKELKKIYNSFEKYAIEVNDGIRKKVDKPNRPWS